jgi:hypothetical protein
VVPTTGPRSAAVGAPQRIAGAPLAPWTGWDVSRMCPLGLGPVVPLISEPMHCFRQIRRTTRPLDYKRKLMCTSSCSMPSTQIAAGSRPYTTKPSDSYSAMAAWLAA